MNKKTKVFVLVLSFFILFSFAGENICKAYVLNKDEVTAQPEKDDVIQDPMLNWVIRTAIHKTKDRSYAKLIKEDLQKDLPEVYYSEGDHYDLYEFNVFVKSIEGLQHATNTERILLPYNKISDLKPIKNLTKLNKVIMNCNEISDITPLSNLTNMVDIHLGDNDITTIEPLAKMTKLESLNVELNHKISDISAVKNFQKLKYLNLGYNDIKDIASLRDLKDIETLILGNNKVADINSIENMKKLKELDISSNNISDISVLKNFINLKILRLSNNSGINDIAPLTNLTKLDKNELWLTGTAIADKKDDLFKVIDVNKLINKFKANFITMKDKKKVSEARKAYNLLSPQLRKYIPELRISAAEDNISRLEKGGTIKHYDELNEFDKLPLELEHMKSLEVMVLNKKGQPMSGVKFVVKTEFGYKVADLTSNENGVFKYNISMFDKFMKYKIELLEKEKYTSNISEIVFTMDGTPKISKINENPVTGSENLKFILTSKNDDIANKVDKTRLEKAIKDAESKDVAKYTEESYKKLNDALVVAKAILGKKDATQNEVDLNTTNVVNAISKLVEKNTKLEVKPEVKSQPEAKPQVKSVSSIKTNNIITDNKKANILPKTGEEPSDINLMLGMFLSAIGVIMLLDKKKISK